MKTTLLLIVMLILACPVYSQDRKLIGQKIQDNNTLQSSIKALWWIKTPNDFSQTDLSSDEIDSKIDSIILKQKNKPVMDIETPINLKKLKYYEYLDVNKIGIIGNSSLFSTNPSEYADANGARNIFRYGNITILCTFNSYEDQIHVYSIIRAVLILKNKYPEIYNDLFTATESSPLSNAKLVKDIPQSSDTVLNINRNYVFSVHTNNNKTANATTSSYSAKYREDFLERWISDNNTHLIFFNKETLRNGGVATGTNPIYKNASTKTVAHVNFLFDGILQTIVHERLHDYIANQKSLNKFFDYVRNNQEFITDKAACENSTYLCLEEPIVTNTTNRLFDKHGGISADVMTYYKDLFTKTQVATMKSNTDFNKLIPKLKGLNTKSISNDYIDVLSIYF